MKTLICSNKNSRVLGINHDGRRWNAIHSDIFPLVSLAGNCCPQKQKNQSDSEHYSTPSKPHAYAATGSIGAHLIEISLRVFEVDYNLGVPIKAGGGTSNSFKSDPLEMELFPLGQVKPDLLPSCAVYFRAWQPDVVI